MGLWSTLRVRGLCSLILWLMAGKWPLQSSPMSFMSLHYAAIYTLLYISLLGHFH